MTVWHQPLDPLGSLLFSALAASAPLAILLVLMGALRKSGLVAAVWGLLGATVMALLVWRMPTQLAAWSTIYGMAFGLWPIMWIVFAALWLYNLTTETGSFHALRQWMAEHASGDPRIQAILVGFCFGALLEGTAGFGTPVAVAACLLVGLGFTSQRAVAVSLIANTAPVAFGGLGIPIVALAGVTGLDQMKLSAMVGRQLPFLSLVLPAYLVLVVSGGRGLRETWPAALVAGASFALAQFVVSNFWGPYAADIVAAATSTAALVLFLRIWKPPQKASRANPTMAAVEGKATASQAFAAWAPWLLLSGVMIIWSYLDLFQRGQVTVAIPALHQGIFITLYAKPYSALYRFQPLAAGTAAVLTIALTSLIFRVRLGTVLRCAVKTFHQLRLPGATVALIVGLAYLYNYSGMAYTLGAALARLGWIFPLVSGFLGWIACFLSGSDSASNLLFGNLQVAVAHQTGISPILLAATNSSGAVTGKIISPQNIAVGVTTVNLVGQEGTVLRSVFWHSVFLASLLSLLALAQAYWLKWMIP